MRWTARLKSQAFYDFAQPLYGSVVFVLCIRYVGGGGLSFRFPPSLCPRALLAWPCSRQVVPISIPRQSSDEFSIGSTLSACAKLFGRILRDERVQQHSTSGLIHAKYLNDMRTCFQAYRRRVAGIDSSCVDECKSAQSEANYASANR